MLRSNYPRCTNVLFLRRLTLNLSQTELQPDDITQLRSNTPSVTGLQILQNYLTQKLFCSLRHEVLLNFPSQMWKLDFHRSLSEGLLLQLPGGAHSKGKALTINNRQLRLPSESRGATLHGINVTRLPAAPTPICTIMCRYLTDKALICTDIRLTHLSSSLLTSAVTRNH